ncbi:gap junction Cx32.2 protein-like [Hemibagrus wyckioides]|uniref:gap junction Cx32.2 protein-like n=1 Tax=Hemibagrus wyckioides TaxID=337641 RepID=UPI00266BC7A8|nr:gap junction Cx32.2 protein-like [Hemibagrus wyckioides]XP_058235528.1 gap junction Cx32.2 protein-like [Hemibagrus wyckioides]
MEMRDWGFLYLLLDKVQSHSTVIGKIWMRALFVFRILILGAAAEIIWADEQPRIVCNTQQPGCKTACYDFQFPISPIRYWVIQVIVVSMPSLLYLCHVIHIAHLENTLRARIKPQHDETKHKPKYTDEQIQRKIQCSLWASRFTQLFFKIILELAFIAGFYYLYGFIMSPGFSCPREPCPNYVECYITAATEKNIFNIFMLGIAGVSLLLNVIEVVCLLCSRVRSCHGKWHVKKFDENPTSLF